MRSEGMKNTVQFSSKSTRLATLIENKEVGFVNYFSTLTGGSMPTGFKVQEVFYIF